MDGVGGRIFYQESEKREDLANGEGEEEEEGEEED